MLPTIERCDATADENCDSLDCIVWAAAFEQTGTFEPSSIAADQEGNVFVSGSFTGTISIANQTFSSAGSTDGLLLKLSPDGQPLWAKKVGDILEDSIAALAPRPDGSLYIGGGTSSPVDFGGGVLPAGLYVAKLDADGGLVWSKGFGGRGAMASLAIDAQESVVAAGFFRDALDYGDGPIPAAGWYDIVVAKLDGMSGAITSPTGWVRTFGDPDFQFAYAVAVDSSSNIFVAGEVSGSVSFGGGAGTIQANGEDGFLLKITPGGAASWVRSQGGAGNQRARGVAVDSQGRPVVVGRFEGQIEVGSGTLPAAGTTDGFVLQLSTTGSILWGRAIGDASPQSLDSVAIDPAGDILIAGLAAGQVDLGGGALQAVGAGDGIVAKLSADGEHIWSRLLGTEAQDLTWAVAASPAGETLTASTTMADAPDFGTGPLPSGATADEQLVIVKLGR